MGPLSKIRDMFVPQEEWNEMKSHWTSPWRTVGVVWILKCLLARYKINNSVIHMHFVLFSRSHSSRRIRTGSTWRWMGLVSAVRCYTHQSVGSWLYKIIRCSICRISWNVQIFWNVSFVDTSFILLFILFIRYVPSSCKILCQNLFPKPQHSQNFSSYFCRSFSKLPVHQIFLQNCHTYWRSVCFLWNDTQLFCIFFCPFMHNVCISSSVVSKVFN